MAASRDEMIARIRAQQELQRRQQAAGPQLAPRSERIARGATSGALTGTSQLLGLPGTVNQLVLDAVNAAANRLGYQLDLQTPSALMPETIEGAYREATGVEAPTPEELGTAGRAAQLAGQAAPAFMVPFPGSAVAAARSGAPVTRALLADVGEAAGAGTAQALAEEAGMEGPLGQLGAAVAGGLTGRIGADTGVSAARGALESRLGRFIQETAANVAPTVVPRPPEPGPPVPRVPSFETGELLPERRSLEAASVLQDLVRRGDDVPEAAADALRRAAEERAAAGIRSRATTGQLADTPGLAALDQSMRGRRSAEVDAIQREAGQEIQRNLRGIAPETTPPALRQLADEDFAALAQAERNVARAEADLAAAEAARAGTPVRADTPVPAEVASETIDRAVRESYDAAVQQRNALYDAIDPAGTRILQLRPGPTTPPAGGTVLNPGGSAQLPLLDSMATVQQTTSRLSGPTANSWREVTSDIEDYINQGFVSLRDLNRLNQRLEGQIRRAQRSDDPVIAGELAQALITLKGGVRETMDSLGTLSAGATPEAAAATQAAQAAREFTAQEFGPTFRDDRAGELARASRGRGEGQVPVAAAPSQTGRQYLAPGQPEAAEQLSSIVGRLPTAGAATANEAVRDFLVGDLLRTVQGSGAERINPAQLERWVTKHKTVLDQFPDVRANVDDMVRQAKTAQTNVDTAVTTLRGQQDQVTAVRQQLKDDPVQLFREIESAPNAVAAIMGGRNPVTEMRRVVDRIGTDTAALNNLKQATRDHIQEQTRALRPVGPSDANELRTSWAQVDKLLRKQRPILAQVYSPEEMQALDRIWNITRDASRGVVQAVPGSQTQPRLAAEAVKTAAETAARIQFGLLRGGGITRMANRILELVGRTFSGGLTPQQAIDEVVDRAMLDPAIAERLLRTRVPVTADTRLMPAAAPLGASVGQLPQE